MASEESQGANGANLPLNSVIEVSGDDEEGFKGSWSRAALVADGLFTVKVQFTEVRGRMMVGPALVPACRATPTMQAAPARSRSHT